jgi:hypothetical protein
MRPVVCYNIQLFLDFNPEINPDVIAVVKEAGPLTEIMSKAQNRTAEYPFSRMMNYS